MNNRGQRILTLSQTWFVGMSRGVFMRRCWFRTHPTGGVKEWFGVVGVTRLMTCLAFVFAMGLGPGVGGVSVESKAAAAGGDAEGASSGASGGGAYRVTTTVAMVTDIVRQVAGPHARVEGLMREGVDPHLYKPSRTDVIKLMNADVVFYNGLMLEGKMTDVLVKASRSGKPVYAVTEMLQEASGYVMNDPQQHYDPHVWMDVSGWVKAVEAVAGALGEYDPEHRGDYETNAKAYLLELRKLDDYAKRVIGSIPPQQRVLVTAHDAFGYFGRAYGVEVHGIQGLSTESEAGIKDINNLIDFLVKRQVGAVFVETSVADKNVRALIEGAHARGWDVRIGGTLFSDAMGKPPVHTRARTSA